MRRSAVFNTTFPARLAAFERLLEAASALGEGGAALRAAAADLDEAAAQFGADRSAAAYAAFADIVRIAALLVDWRKAVLDATADAERFQRAAAAREALWRAEHGERPDLALLASVVAAVPAVSVVSEVRPWVERLGSTPLPVAIFGDGENQRRKDGDTAEVEPPSPELVVAFLKFTVDGEAASETHFLTPRETHDLALEVRVSRWPEGSMQMTLMPVTLEAPGAHAFPSFTFTRPEGDAPFLLSQTGRAAILAAQALRAMPVEFKYTARFSPTGGEQPVSIVGHRTLRIESYDFQSSSLTGYPALDRTLVDVRNQLRGRLPPPVDDLSNTMTLLVALAALAGRAVQDNAFPSPMSEKAFQKLVRDELRRRPEIGVNLEEHPAAAGGLTDLSFRGIRLELKVESKATLKAPDCQVYVEQAASYAVGTNKRVAILCVLDVSPKTAAPFPAEDGLAVLTSQGEVAVPTLVIQGALQRPSDLSRRRRKS